MKIQQLYTVLLLGLLTLALGACNKEDIMPAPVGEPVPYKPAATRTWQAIMQDADFSTFNAAWKRSNMNAWIVKTNSQFHTLFIPTNKAMADAGWTDGRVNLANVTELDSLLAYYVVAGMYTPANLKVPMNRSMVLNTMLTRPGVLGYNTNQPYRYRLRVGSFMDSLMVNGKTMGKWQDAEEATNGSVYKINQMVYKPVRTMAEYVKSDPRFSMLLTAIETSVPYYEIDWKYSNDPLYMDYLTGSSNMALRTTLFLPTNQAFANSGIKTEQDIHDIIARSLPIGDPDYDENMFYQTPTTSIDSMLRPHGFSISKGGFVITYTSGGTDLVFYKNDLLNNPGQLSAFLYQPGQAYYGGDIRIETSFANQNGTLMVRDWKSTGPWQPIVEADIECLNGVIHVVNDFIMKP